MSLSKTASCEFCDATDDVVDGACPDCYHEHYEFTCCACEEYGHIDDQHKFVVVFEDGYGVPPGLYQPTGSYFTASLIGSAWLHPHALKLIAPLPVRWLGYVSITRREVYRELKTDNGGGYPCGHLCAECQTAIRKSLAKRRGRPRL